MVTTDLPATSGHDDAAGLDRLTVEMDGAGAAERNATTEFRSGQAKLVAQVPQSGIDGSPLNARSCPFTWTLTITPSDGGSSKPRTAASQLRDVAGFRRPVDARRHMRRLRPGILFIAVRESFSTAK